MKIYAIRKSYHEKVCDNILSINDSNGKKYPNFSDISSRASINIGFKIIELLGFPVREARKSEQTVGDLFENYTKEFIENCFELLTHIRPGSWIYSTYQTEISRFEQYEHLADIEKKIKGDKELTTALGRDYLVKPDIIVARYPIDNSLINAREILLEQEDTVSRLTPLRKENSPNSERKILHASISCKWTIRSDRSQNTRTEALNLIRNRKGNLPHVVAVTAEPLPTRIATLALGTGDLDCVYHFALPELQEAVNILQNEDQKDILNIMVRGKRLRDISDLPFDLAI